MTDEQRGSEVYKPESTEGDRRRWWEKQRWLVPIAVVVLILAVIAVTAFLRSESDESPEAAIAEDGDAQAQSEGGTQASAAPSPEAQGGGDDAEQQQDPETAQVCRRIVALQDEVQSQGINGMNPLDVYTELTEIERQSRGTQVASLANDAAVTVQRFITGRTDADAVYAAGTALASAC